MLTRLPRPPLALAGAVVLLAFAAQLELWTRLPGSKLLLVTTALAYTLPLIAVRQYPLSAFAVVNIALGVEAVFARTATREAGAPLFAGLAAAFVVALFAARRDAIVALGLAFITVALVARDAGGFASGAVTFLFTGALLAIAWEIGFVLRERRQRADVAERRATDAEHERDIAARIATAEERTRIARELHDVVAHALSVMVLRTTAARHKLPSGLDDLDRALQEVEQAGRDALAEMRHLLGALRTDAEAVELAPQAGIGRLSSLAEAITQAGLSVEIRIDGEPVPLPAGVDRSAFRIVQEGLTNALKHAHARHAQVQLSYTRSDLWLEISDDGIGPQAGDGRGHGLVGVRERVKIYDGEMETQAGPDGGFILRARLPIQGTPR